ncbi:hypothetical protein H0H93_000753 [Arthromyces matolae]|nr:hypothetical protein H0H93_000753 [Arthromyces matolae]
MATLPRTSKMTASLFQRTVSDFDAGLNTSAAWTEHLVSGSEEGSLSDEEFEHENEVLRLARSLYDFEGKAEFRELTVRAGDDIEIIKEHLADGWSLVKNTQKEVGLLPRTYYTFTSDFTPAPGLQLPPTTKHARKISNGSITPRGSPKANPEPLIPQNTGEWIPSFPSFRRSLLGGKSLNRFSSFVTSGAEEFVLKGTPADFVVTHALSTSEHVRERTDATFDEEEIHRLNRQGLGESDRHFIEAGPMWKEKLPSFSVLVHSPSKRTSTFSTPYTLYCVSSVFQPESPDPTGDTSCEQSSSPQGPSTARVTVYRRFTHFVMLHTVLTRRLPGIALPPLPEKQYAGRFNDDFVEARRGDLERYINKVVRHPVARYAEVITVFLGCENEVDWDRLIRQHLSIPAAGSAFYGRIFHPAFNVDSEDALETVERFDGHTKAVEKGVQGLRNVFERVREARIEMSKAERLLSYSLLSMITAKPLASSLATVEDDDEEQESTISKGVINNEGAWCWRDDCQDCLKLTKAIQKSAETLQVMADSFDDHPITTTHKETLSRYIEATQAGKAEEELAARCETVLNLTLAEMETYHTQKIEDFGTFAKEHLDGEIRFYEQILNKLYAARANFDEPAFSALADSPRQSSIYERELENPRLNAQPLPQPCPHVFDSAPMRPVSVAIQEGMGMLLGPSARGSVFAKFW